jgi:hypothetical protein
MPGLVQKRGDRRADGAGTDECDVCGDGTEITSYPALHEDAARPSRLGFRFKVGSIR